MPKNFRIQLVQALKAHLHKGRRLPIHWTCDFCGNAHKGNLFKRVTEIREDVVSGELKADIGLFTEDQQLLAAIHISKNKNPTKTAVDHYQANTIIFIQVVPGEDIHSAIASPFYVGTCLNPRCKTCGGFQHDKSLLVIDCHCWKCKGPMKVAVLEGGGYRFGPDRFSTRELELARQHGADIRNNYSKTRQEAYLSNTCPQCAAMTGDHFLFTDYYHAAMMGDFSYERITQGYFCEPCFHGVPPGQKAK